MININGVWYKGRLVFDFDGVICVFGAKDYSKAIPYENAVKHINQVFSEGWYVVICTARYMLRCKGDLKEVYRKGYTEASVWLRKFGVKFNELVLGKPSADLYTDDRGCRVESNKGEADWNNNFWPLVKQIEEANAELRLQM